MKQTIMVTQGTILEALKGCVVKEAKIGYSDETEIIFEDGAVFHHAAWHDGWRGLAGHTVTLETSDTILKYENKWDF